MRVVCCLCYGKGECPEKEVVKIVEVITRWHEGSLQALAVSESQKGPSA